MPPSRIEHIIIGIDPGLARTGWGVIGFNGIDARYIAAGYAASSPSDPLDKRLWCLSEQLEQTIALYRPAFGAMEQTFLNSNAKSSLALGHARGALLVTLARTGIRTEEYSATSVKKTVAGNGRATKETLAAMLPYLLKEYTSQSGTPSDVTDALAVAICRSRMLSWDTALQQAAS